MQGESIRPRIAGKATLPMVHDAMLRYEYLERPPSANRKVIDENFGDNLKDYVRKIKNPDLENADDNFDRQTMATRVKWRAIHRIKPSHPVRVVELSIDELGEVRMPRAPTWENLSGDSFRLSDAVLGLNRVLNDSTSEISIFEIAKEFSYFLTRFLDVEIPILQLNPKPVIFQRGVDGPERYFWEFNSGDIQAAALYQMSEAARGRTLQLLAGYNIVKPEE
jgi:hypothetical protein